MAFFSETKLATVPVQPEDQLTLKVVIGKAQCGGWAYRLGKVVKKGPGSLDKPLAIGSGVAALAARLLHVNATVFDCRPETDDLPATVEITRVRDGAVFTIDFLYQGGAGDSACFTAAFVFQELG